MKLNDKVQEIDALKKELERIDAELIDTDEMIPLKVFENGEAFGELALSFHRPRAGTVLCVTGCFFAVIGADAYEKLIKKDQ